MAVHSAAQRGDTKTMLAILSKKNKTYSTSPYYYAAFNGHTETMLAAIARGASTCFDEIEADPVP